MKKLTDHKRYERLLAAVQNGDIDRRSLLRIIGATAAVVGVTGGPIGLLRSPQPGERRAGRVLPCGSPAGRGFCHLPDPGRG